MVSKQKQNTSTIVLLCVWFYETMSVFCDTLLSELKESNWWILRLDSRSAPQIMQNRRSQLVSTRATTKLSSNKTFHRRFLRGADVRPIDSDALIQTRENKENASQDSQTDLVDPED